MTITPSVSITKSVTPSPTPIYEQIILYNQSILTIYQSTTTSENFGTSFGIALGAFLAFLISCGCYIFWSCFYWKKKREVECEKCKGKFLKDKIEMHKRVCNIKTYVDDESELTIVDKIYKNL
jgi:hypothetical protein